MKFGQKMTRNILKVLAVSAIFPTLVGCFSTYPIQRQFPCSETTLQEKLQLIEDAYNSKMKPEHLEITEKGVVVGKKSYNFDEIRYVRAKKKPGPFYSYQRYWIQIREYNNDMNEIYLRDFDTMVKANNALMCLTDLQATNGRPREKRNPATAPIETKYDDLEKIKKLLDDGVLTQEEYEAEKKKILGE